MGAYTQGKVVDPVCGMEVSPASTNLVSTHKGRRYYFCAVSKTQRPFRPLP
jgi:YHS domain-containing protein